MDQSDVLLAVSGVILLGTLAALVWQYFRNRGDDED